MKIGYLILSHQDPVGLSRLIKRLDTRNSSFFIHIDAKVDAGPFQAAAPEATFITDRVAVHWCGFSMVEATFRLLRAAYALPIDRFVLLSGADYPIKSNSQIQQILETELEYIQVDRRLDEKGSTHFDLCARRLFLGDIPWLNPRTGNPPLIALTTRLTKHYRRQIDFPLYYGPSWWALTRAAVADILQVAKEKPEILRAFRWSQSPDEMVFQTIVKASTGPPSSHSTLSTAISNLTIIRRPSTMWTGLGPIRTSPERSTTAILFACVTAKRSSRGRLTRDRPYSWIGWMGKCRADFHLATSI